MWEIGFKSGKVMLSEFCLSLAVQKLVFVTAAGLGSPNAQQTLGEKTNPNLIKTSSLNQTD